MTNSQALSHSGSLGHRTRDDFVAKQNFAGTTNFVHTFPSVAVCIGLAVDKRPVMGVVFCPALEQMFTARRGNGAYCNGQRLAVRCSPTLRESLVCTELGSDRSEAKRQCVFKNMDSVGWQCHGLRALGSAAMNICAVASGQANAFYEFGLHCWDMCAPGAILIEAGGFICDTTGEEFDLLKRRVIVACNQPIGRELARALVVQMDLAHD